MHFFQIEGGEEHNLATQSPDRSRLPATLPRAPAEKITKPTLRAESWAKAYNLWIKSRASPHTRRAYASAWASFQAHIAKTPWEVTRADIALWVESQRSAGLSPATISQRLAALSSFFTYSTTIRERVCQPHPELARGSPQHFSNPLQSFPRPKQRAYRSARYLTIPEARALLRAINRQTLQGLRDYALFLISIRTYAV